MGTAHTQGLLSVAAAAELLDLHPDSIRRRVAAGELGYVRLGKSPKAPIRIEAAELDRYLEAGRVRARERHEGRAAGV